jgi:tyrosinase
MKMDDNFTRRRFLTTLGATAGVTLAGKSLFNMDKVFATSGPFTRLNIANLTISSQTIQSYIAGIQAMQALGPTDQRSWSYQAAIHGTTMTNLMPDWDTCSHHAFELNFFWAWHRMYLYWFERIVRSFSGDPTFALPYWDWQNNPYLPSMFQNPPGNSTLYTSNRNFSINNGSQSVDPSGTLTPGVNNTFAQPIFEYTSIDGADQLIQIPHDQVHGMIGGGMGSTLTAALDPVFFVHHANVDRLWDLWLANNALNSDPTSDTVWGATVFNFFDENANAVSMTPCDVLRAAQQLNYVYENDPTQVDQYCGNTQLCSSSYTVLVDSCIQKPPFYLKQGGYYGYYEFPISYQLGQQIYGYLKNPYNTIYLSHYGITTPTQPGVYWDVYIGLPLGAKPTHESPYYVGGFAMYGGGIADQPPDGNDPAEFSLPVNTAILAALEKLKKGGNITVTFFPNGPSRITTQGPAQKATVTIQGAQLVLQTVTPTDRAAGKRKEERKVIAQVTKT